MVIVSNRAIASAEKIKPWKHNVSKGSGRADRI